MILHIHLQRTIFFLYHIWHVWEWKSFKTISQPSLILDFKIVATISDGWTNSACGLRKLGIKSAKHLREYYCPCCFVTIQTSLPQAFLWHGGGKKRKDRPRLQHTVFYLSKSLSWVHSNNFNLKVPRQLQAGGCKYRHVHCVHSLYDFLFLCVSVTAASPRNCLRKHSLVTSIPGPEKPDITKIWCKLTHLDGLDKF